MKTKALQSSFVQRSLLLAATVVAGAALFTYLTVPRASAATTVDGPAAVSVQDNYAVDEALALKLFVHRGDYTPAAAQGHSS
ncbi:hypothetical protein [Aromatoleum evansii]|uniref:Uncharacterized protein n=1 Tax=Aromatoleum evansii TaxID=59406 RepID=A0ABZ1AI88_AROEV|nr:hypothetical protein [Aromatoleum evansii]NMG28792.1 hypothetical protein [Aromatoleum evansii]WRL45587.1 hypothetical protein U5817_20650 [Aromatoleum evansii]